MPQRPVRTLILAGLAAAIAAGVALVVLQRRCIADGGQFDWGGAACTAGARPIILQGEIHRV